MTMKIMKVIIKKKLIIFYNKMDNNTKKMKGRPKTITNIDELRQKNNERAKKYYQDNKDSIKIKQREYYEKKKKK